MRKFAAFLAVGALASLVPTTSSVARTGHTEGPSLKLKAPHMTFMRPPEGMNMRSQPVTIRVTAELKDLDKVAAEDREKYYCLEEVWEWDDDTHSEYAPDCDPYKEGTEIETHFGGTHQYRDPGSYNVMLRLERNGKVVLSGNVRVQIGG